VHLIEGVIKHEDYTTMSNGNSESTPTKSNGVKAEAEPVLEMEEEEPQDKPEVVNGDGDGDKNIPVEEDEDGTEEDDDEDENENSEDEEDEDEKKANAENVLREAEAKAIADATASANASYTPSNALLSNPSPSALVESVDGICISEYNQSPSLFTAHSVPVALRATLDVPIIITNGGSVVEYTVESENYDINFGIKAEREEETTVVNALTRVDTHLESVTGKFLVGTVPCALIFTFCNEFSWFREKKITYCITVTPPSIENIIAGRVKRAESALGVVLEEKTGADTRLERASAKRGGLAEEIERLEKELEEKKKSLDVIEKEEDWLKARVELRGEQERLLKKRLTDGWDDEKKADVPKVEQAEF